MLWPVRATPQNDAFFQIMSWTVEPSKMNYLFFKFKPFCQFYWINHDTECLKCKTWNMTFGRDPFLDINPSQAATKTTAVN